MTRWKFKRRRERKERAGNKCPFSTRRGRATFIRATDKTRLYHFCYGYYSTTEGASVSPRRNIPLSPRRSFCGRFLFATRSRRSAAYLYRDKSATRAPIRALQAPPYNTGEHSNQDPSCTPKPEKFQPFFKAYLVLTTSFPSVIAYFRPEWYVCVICFSLSRAPGWFVDVVCRRLSRSSLDHFRRGFVCFV